MCWVWQTLMHVVFTNWRCSVAIFEPRVQLLQKTRLHLGDRWCISWTGCEGMFWVVQFFLLLFFLGGVAFNKNEELKQSLSVHFPLCSYCYKSVRRHFKDFFRRIFSKQHAISKLQVLALFERKAAFGLNVTKMANEKNLQFISTKARQIYRLAHNIIRY